MGEQKLRLKSTGLRLKLYIVEGIPVAETSVAYDMRVVRSRNIDHTIVMLHAITQQIDKRFRQGKCPFKFIIKKSDTIETPLYLTFEYYKRTSGKESAGSLRDLISHQLRQIHGCSPSAVNAFLNAFNNHGPFSAYPVTYHGIMSALSRTSDDPMAVKKIIAELIKVEDGRKLGPVVADAIYTCLMR